MTEEITYADLEFNKSYALENTPKSAAPEEKGLFTSSPWCLAALTLLMLCLMLLIGLLALGVVFFQVTNICQEENVKFKAKEKALQTNFSSRLQEIRESLCLEGEVKNENNEMSCTLCPTNWQQMGEDTCYYVSSGKKTWEGSRNFCASRNSTLLMIKDQQKMISVGRYFIKKRYWIGLSRPDTERNSWFLVDNTAISERMRVFVYDGNNPCAYLLDSYIYAHQRCTENNFWICEKTPIQLRLTDDP